MTKKKPKSEGPYQDGYNSFMLGSSAECPIDKDDKSRSNTSEYRFEWYRGYYDARIHHKLKHIFEKYRVMWLL